MKQIAIYGKGGIGKSTISANISYQLAGSGLKVAQIGCDPKHDSTRLLLGGKAQTTVLDHMGSGIKDLGDTVSVGSNGVICIETGGPEPGVGCAGRGILTAFNFMEANDVVPDDTDVMVYDVLGDVVCGGFAVPLRRKYADAVFIVTSGEFMSLYAANNVLKGIRNFDGDGRRVAGLILNRRGNEGEIEYVQNFADAVGLPIVTVIPRSGDFAEAESKGITVSEMAPDSEAAAAVSKITRIVKGLLSGKAELYPARPLDDDGLDLVAKGKKAVRDSVSRARPRKLATGEGEALRSCGAVMSVYCCAGIEDADVVVHGPRSCHCYFSGGYDSFIIFNDRVPYMKGVDRRIFCTNLTDRSAIFGGAKELEKLLRERAEAGAKLIFAVTACVPGIIGDDVEGVCARVSSETGAEIIPVLTDGIMNGGATQGRDIAYAAICRLVDMSVRPEENTVNLIGYAEEPDRGFRKADECMKLIGGLGLNINCRFLHENTADEVRMLKKGGINLMYRSSLACRKEAGCLEKLTGIPFYPDAMPVGIRQTEEWIEGFGSFMKVPEERRKALSAEFRKEFDELSGKYRDALAGSTCLIYVVTTSEIGWLMEILSVLGMKAVGICCPTENRWSMVDRRSVEGLGAPVEYDVDFDRLREKISSEKPDCLIGSSIMISRAEIPHTYISRPLPGVAGGFEFAKRLVRMAQVSRL